MVRVSLKPVELLDVARNEGITVALDHFVECGGCLSKVASVKKGLEIMIPPKPRWAPPPWKIVLYPWQKRVWEVVNTPPITRRTIWIHGSPGTGKTVFGNCLTEKLEGGAINFGATLKAAEL